MRRGARRSLPPMSKVPGFSPRSIDLTANTKKFSSAMRPLLANSSVQTSISASSIFCTSWFLRRVRRPTSAIVLFLSSDIFTIHLCLNLGRLSLLRSTFHRANIGHRRLRTLECFGFSCLGLCHALLGSLGERVLIIFLGFLPQSRNLIWTVLITLFIAYANPDQAFAI